MVKPFQTQVDDFSILKTDRQISTSHVFLSSLWSPNNSFLTAFGAKLMPSKFSSSKVVDDFMDLTHYTVSVMGCMVSLSAGGS
jgi:hypothetical protein